MYMYMYMYVPLFLVLYSLLFYIFIVWRLTKSPSYNLYQRIYYQTPHEKWRRKNISYCTMLKALRVLKLMRFIFQAIDCSEDEYEDILPILLYFESNVYSADIETEECQSQGKSLSNRQWMEDILYLLKGYNLYNEEDDKLLDNIYQYFLLECAIKQNAVEINEEVITDLCTKRSADLYFLIMLIYKIRNLPPPQSFVNFLMGEIALGEIEDDLDTYESDIKNDSFNMLTLYVLAYNKEDAFYHLQQRGKKILESMMMKVKHLSQRQLACYWAANLKIYGGIPFNLCRAFFALCPKFLLATITIGYLQNKKKCVFGKAPSVLS